MLRTVYSNKQEIKVTMKMLLTRHHHHLVLLRLNFNVKFGIVLGIINESFFVQSVHFFFVTYFNQLNVLPIRRALVKTTSVTIFYFINISHQKPLKISLLNVFNPNSSQKYNFSYYICTTHVSFVHKKKHKFYFLYFRSHTHVSNFTF